jgi:hypothetical protein
MVRIRAPESGSNSFRELLPLFTTQSFELATTTAWGLLNRYGPLALHVIQVTAPSEVI